MNFPDFDPHFGWIRWKLLLPVTRKRFRTFMYTLEINNVSKTYGDPNTPEATRAVENLSFNIAQGTMFGLLGPNGSGKTSTIRLMVGITYPDTGSVNMFGEPFRRDHLKRVGYLPEERGLYQKMNVLEQLVFMGEIHGLTAAEARKRAESWGQRLDIAHAYGKKTQELSKGMQQKIQFIATLLHEPEFIIMDEPFSGLDPVNARLLEDTLLDLRKQGRTILFSTHRMDQVEKLCDSICLINKGKAVLQGDLREIKSRYGRNRVQIAFETEAAEAVGASATDGVFLNNNPMIQKLDRYEGYVQVTLNDRKDIQRLFQDVASKSRVSRFELMEPSLEDIFIEVVGKTEA
jgi:ABC-2 type transport system ATP-binding protein